MLTCGVFVSSSWKNNRATLFLMTTPMKPLARCAAISSPATAAALAQLAQPFAVRECITDASFAEFTILRNVRCIAQFNFSQACLFTYPSYMAVALRTSGGEVSEVIGDIAIICNHGIIRKHHMWKGRDGQPSCI